MDAVKEFRKAKREDFKEFKRIVKGKEDGKTSLDFFNYVKEKYNHFEISQLENLKYYLSDYKWSLDVSTKHNKILYAMDNELYNVLPTFIMAVVAIFTIITQLVVSEVDVATDVNYEEGTKLLLSTMKRGQDFMQAVGITFVVIIFIVLLVNIAKYYSVENIDYNKYYIDGYLKTIDEIIAWRESTD